MLLCMPTIAAETHAMLEKLSAQVHADFVGAHGRDATKEEIVALNFATGWVFARMAKDGQAEQLAEQLREEQTPSEDTTPAAG